MCNMTLHSTYNCHHAPSIATILPLHSFWMHMQKTTNTLILPPTPSPSAAYCHKQVSLAYRYQYKTSIVLPLSSPPLPSAAYCYGQVSLAYLYQFQIIFFTTSCPFSFFIFCHCYSFKSTSFATSWVSIVTRRYPLPTYTCNKQPLSILFLPFLRILLQPLLYCGDSSLDSV